MSDHDEGYAAGCDAFGNKSVDQFEALLKKRSMYWTTGFMDADMRAAPQRSTYVVSTS